MYIVCCQFLISSYTTCKMFSTKLICRVALFKQKVSVKLVCRNVKTYQALRCNDNVLNSNTTVKRIFSGIQPTGSLHLGNYFGAVQRWVELQGNDAVFSIVDLHSITLPQDPKILQSNIFHMAASLISCGIDPEKCILFQQSKVPQHSELSWILGCLTTLPRLGHLPQFKEKSSKLKEIPLGIYIYPVLQSADILLYKATHVPVGEDQLQHIQLAQHLVRVFNNKYGDVLIRPTAILGDNFSSRLKSLRSSDKKMSKSDPDPKSRIELTDTPEEVMEKCKKALTDFTSAVTFEPEKRPAVANLISLHSLCTGLTPDEICRQNSNLETAQYKLVVGEAVNIFLDPIRKRYSELMKDPSYIIKVLEEGASKARNIAEETLSQVKKVVGLSIS